MSSPKSPEELRKGLDASSGSSAKQRRHYLKLIENGLCVSCGKVPPVPNRRRCQSCADKYGGGTRSSSYFLEWRAKNIAEGRCSKCGVNPHAPNRKLCQTCLTDSLARTKESFRLNPEVFRARKRALKLETFAAYGGAFCACCGFTGHLAFLTLGHIANDGAAHRKAIWGKSQGVGGGEHMYYWLKKRGFPPGFEVQCWNCNCAAAKNGGICPHKQGAL